MHREERWPPHSSVLAVEWSAIWDTASRLSSRQSELLAFSSVSLHSGKNSRLAAHVASHSEEYGESESKTAELSLPEGVRRRVHVRGRVLRRQPPPQTPPPS